MNTPMKVLIVKLSAVGDVVMSLPVLEALRCKWPEAVIDWVVEEAASDVLVGHPSLNRLVVSRRKAWGRALKSGRILEALTGATRFLRDLRRERYDAVLDLQGLFKSGIVVFFARGRRKIGFDRTREFSWVFLNEKLPPYDPDRHALLRYLDAAAHLGAEGDPEALYGLPTHEPSRLEAARMLDGLRKPLVAINPGAKWDTKLWPVLHWRELCQRLTVDAQASVIVTGSPDEIDENAKIAAGLEGVTDLTGRTGLRILGEIFRLSDLVVCPDTGPMHLAAAVGTPVVALFGPTSPDRTGPFGQGHTVLTAGIECAPCFEKKCPAPKCMTDLTPDRVARAITVKLENRAA